MVASNLENINKNLKRLNFINRKNLIKSGLKYSNYNGKFKILNEINNLIKNDKKN